ncbi:threonine/serine exporter family protein [Dethiothermospora halolimnae]|uniref:threonine/serine exporter family protein n=1 Tax=Dethiothermospora halolimnae TaxID=3114390 RepID=UPI003CCBF5C1
MFFLSQSIYAFLSTIGFAVLFNIPKGSIIKSGFIGGIGWFVFLGVDSLSDSKMAGAFFAAVTVGVLGEFFARFFKKPATVFIIPGIIPLVPGAGMYDTMLAVIEKKFLTAIDIGAETIFIALSIASGIVISSSFSRILKKRRRKLLK